MFGYLECWMDGWLNGWMVRLLDFGMTGQVHGWIDGWLDGLYWMVGQLDEVSMF